MLLRPVADPWPFADASRATPALVQALDLLEAAAEGRAVEPSAALPAWDLIEQHVAEGRAPCGIPAFTSPEHPALTQLGLCVHARADDDLTVHEFGHALAALAMGFTPTVRPASVDYGTAPPDMEVIIALAGPLVSLITGVLFLILCVP